jgi:hypothetical protein
MAVLTINSGVNVITYRGSTPLNFSAITNFETIVTKVKIPDCKGRPGGSYNNFFTYTPPINSGLNDYLTLFSGISSYIIQATSSFTITEQGSTLTPPLCTMVTAPLALVGFDTNRVDYIGVSAFDALIKGVYYYDGSNWRRYSPGTPGLNDLNNASIVGTRLANNFLPGRTYYINSISGQPNWLIGVPRLTDYLTADNDDFLKADNDDNLCV